MAYTIVQYKRFVQAQCTTSNTTIYTVPAATQDVIKGFDVCVTATCTVTIYIVPNGGTVGPAYALLYLQSVSTQAPFHYSGTITMNSGDFIVASASVASTATVTFSGMELQ